MTSLNESQLYQLIQSVQVDDPVIKDLFREFVKRMQVIHNELFPGEGTSGTQDDIPDTTDVGDVASFTYTLLQLGIKFEWDRPSNAVLFEIRKGTSWADSSRQLVTSTLSAVLDGQPVGTHTYLIKGQAIDGSQSENATVLNVVIPALGTIIVSGTVIDNFVLLSWTIPASSFRIDYYILTKDGIEIGRSTGTFIPVFENTSGVYQYGVQAVDIFENVSAVATKDLTVFQPADYVLESLETDDLTGTRTNVLRDAELPSLFACVDLTETWADYAANGHATLQDEIDAGLPYWLQPTLASGEYEKIFDYGAVFDGVIVSIDYNYNMINPTVTVDTYLSTSIDNVTYGSEVLGTTVYAPSLRYLKVRIEFNALN
jgi:hypothetical protein